MRFINNSRPRSGDTALSLGLLSLIGAAIAAIVFFLTPEAARSGWPAILICIVAVMLALGFLVRIGGVSLMSKFVQAAARFSRMKGGRP